jgi:mono/diheme cytochrome c family protein
MKLIKFTLSLLFVGTLSACQTSEELKKEQYFVEGMELYKTNCANCHQEDGKGMANLYPPISGSLVLTDKEKIACIIRNGMKDTIMVHGNPFSRPMPGNAKLTDIEIAEIVTFVTNKWGSDSTYTSIDFVKQALLTCTTE